MSTEISLSQLQLPTATSNFCEATPSYVKKMRYSTERFVKGPIPLKWLTAAAALHGHALHVAIALCYLSGLTGTSEIILSPSVLRSFHVSRYSGYRALKALESAGLIKTIRRPGAAARVTMLSKTNNVTNLA